MTTLYDSARATVIHGEALAVLHTLPDAHVDAVITDYPADTLQGFVVASAPPSRNHPTEKPLAVMRYLARIAPVNGLVVDPFAGAGTTAAAALLESRHALAIELTEHYARHTANRLRGLETTTPTTPATGPDLWSTTGDTP